MLKTLDLFSGVGGNSLGLVGYTRTIAYCESDPIPDVVVLRDVKSLTAWDFQGNKPDLIVAGFPCSTMAKGCQKCLQKGKYELRRV